MFTQRTFWSGPGAVGMLALLGTTAVVEVVVAVVAFRETGSWLVPASVAAGIGLIAVLGACFARLQVRVDGREVRVSFGPIARTVPLEAIVSVEATTYSPLREFGGWGIRLGRRGWMWNVMGDGGKAVALTLREGRALLCSSREPEALVAAIEAARAERA